MKLFVQGMQSRDFMTTVMCKDCAQIGDALITGIYLSLKDGYAMLNQPVHSTFLCIAAVTFEIFIIF